MQDRPDPTDSTKKPIIRVSLIFEDELVRVEQELKELEEEMARLENEKTKDAENKIKSGIFSFFTRKKEIEDVDEPPKNANPMARAIIHKQMQMVKKMKQQQKM